jgi:hypothetical protein
VAGENGSNRREVGSESHSLAGGPVLVTLASAAQRSRGADWKALAGIETVPSRRIAHSSCSRRLTHGAMLGRLVSGSGRRRDHGADKAPAFFLTKNDGPRHRGRSCCSSANERRHPSWRSGRASPHRRWGSLVRAAVRAFRRPGRDSRTGVEAGARAIRPPGRCTSSAACCYHRPAPFLVVIGAQDNWLLLLGEHDINYYQFDARATRVPPRCRRDRRGGLPAASRSFWCGGSRDLGARAHRSWCSSGRPPRRALRRERARIAGASPARPVLVAGVRGACSRLALSLARRRRRVKALRPAPVAPPSGSSMAGPASCSWYGGRIAWGKDRLATR